MSLKRQTRTEFFSQPTEKRKQNKKRESLRFVFFFLSLALLSCTFLVFFRVNLSFYFPSSIPSGPSNLVADANEVVGQLLDGVGCAAGLDGLRVVRDEDGFGGLNDDDAFSALLNESDYIG